MKVCYLKNWLGTGGSSQLYLDLIKHTSDEAIEYTICHLEGCDEDTAEKFRAEGTRVVGFDFQSKFDPMGIWRMLRFFSNEDFDVLHTHLPYAQTLGRIIGRMTGHQNIISKQSSFPSNYHPITRSLEYITRPLDSKTVAASKGVQKAFTGDANFYQKGEQSRWCTIPNGLDVEDFNSKVQNANPSRIRQKWDIGDEEMVVLNIGRYIPAKSQKDLIYAMDLVTEKVPNTHLLLVGYGELESELRAQIRKLGLNDNITITGYTSSVEDYYAAADLFVLSSVLEGFGIVVIEAMASELPVIGTNIPAIEEIIDQNESGLLVSPESPSELSKAILKLLSSQRLRDELGVSGYERVQSKYNIESMSDNYIKLYSEIYDASY
ncbi:glycosyltransferase [Natrinema limicola]|uniref:Glycosyltransferase n=1 Tax=Natrinema limicola JCM 13563 TaxID=1230457 RepID=M0CFN4_9EURY|nr:glycosyltransferase [Natrinema limicola]ELZ21458.1 glycosyltransferase [Natrinema limicola JCM 13563]